MLKHSLPPPLILSLSLSLLFGLLLLLLMDVFAPYRQSTGYGHLRLNSGFDVITFFTSPDGNRSPENGTKPPTILVAQNLPADLALLSVPQRQRVFIGLMMPHLARRNHLLQKDRNTLLSLMKKKQAYARLTFAEKRWLYLLAQKYGLKKTDLAELKIRVDLIPNSLALAQAILETGWGTSRFAVDGNALFGIHKRTGSQQLFLTSKAGSVRVAAYSNLNDSITAYSRMLNGAPPYQSFRQARAQLRAQLKPLSGFDLANSLTLYSELGREYTARLQTIITRYNLSQFDGIDERPDQAAITVTFARSG